LNRLEGESKHFTDFIQVILTLGGLLGVIYEFVHTGTTQVVIWYPVFFGTFIVVGLVTYTFHAFRKRRRMWSIPLWLALLFTFFMLLGMTILTPLLDAFQCLTPSGCLERVVLTSDQKGIVTVLGFVASALLTAIISVGMGLWKTTAHDKVL
jgi:hypothetical protein